MSTRPPRQEPPSLNERLGGLIVMICVLTIVGLTVADFLNDGHVDRLWIGALVVLALTFGGYGAEKSVEKLTRIFK